MTAPFIFDKDSTYPQLPCCKTNSEVQIHEQTPNSTCLRCLEIYRRDGIEVLPAYRTKTGSWSVWCRYCKAWHTHSPEFGHRVAHCHDLFAGRGRNFRIIRAHDHSGYYNKGYAICLVGEWKDRPKHSKKRTTGVAHD